MSEHLPLGLSSRDRVRMEDVQRLAQSGLVGVAALVELLGEPSWVVRRAVVAALARIGAPAVAPLLALLRDDRTSETKLAAAVDALVASAGDVEAPVLALGRSTAVAAVLCDVAQILGRRKSVTAVPALAEWAGHPDDNVAVASIEALGRIGGASVVEPLLAAIRTRNFFRTFPSIAVLGQSGDPRAVAALTELLAEPSYAAEAASALGRLGLISGVAALARALASSDITLSRAAARALVELRARHVERFGDPADVLDAFRRALDSGIRASVVGAAGKALEGADAPDTIALASVLGWIGSEVGVAALLSLFDADTGAADAAVDALRALDRDDDVVLRAAVRSGDSARRSRLIPLLGARRAAVPDLVVCLEDADPAVRAQACDALGRIGDASIVAAIFPSIGDVDSNLAQAAVGAIQSLGSPETERLALEAAASNDARVRRSALQIISYFGYGAALDVLLRAVTDSDERIREAATGGLALLEDPRALAALLESASHAAASTRAATMRAFGSAIRTPTTVEALLDGLNDHDPWVRYYACQSLGKLRVQSASEAVEIKLRDVAGQVRVAAVEAIARIGGDRALEALEKASLSDDGDVRRSALAGLGALKRPEALTLLSKAAQAPDPSVRLASLLAIAESKLPGVVTLLVRGSSDADERVRQIAFELLAVEPGAEATRWLVSRLAFESDRKLALAALAHRADGRIEEILTALGTAESDLASLLVDALLRPRHPHGNAAAEACLHSPNVHARRAAAAALAYTSNESTKIALAQAAALDPDAEVRRLAAAAS